MHILNQSDHELNDSIRRDIINVRDLVTSNEFS